MIQLADLIQTQSDPTQGSQEIEIAAIIDTALCVGAGGSSGSLADKPILRNAEGRLVIPASQLKGRLRHECEKLAKALSWPICESPVAQSMCPQRAGLPEHNFLIPAYRISERPENGSQTESNQNEPEQNGEQSQYEYHCIICQLFGNPAQPSRVVFNDLICTEAPENIPEVLRPGVTINRRRCTAEESKLYFLETSPANAKLRFEGTLHIQPPGRSPIDTYQAKALLLAGLYHIHALGGGKSTGLGWLQWEFPDANQTKFDGFSWNRLMGGRP